VENFSFGVKSQKNCRAGNEKGYYCTRGECTANPIGQSWLQSFNEGKL
jgi:hypothetical protein